MKDMKDILEEQGFTKEAKVHTEMEITNNPKAVLVLGYNPNDSMSKMFVKNLDKALLGVDGYDKVKIIALDSMENAQLIKKLGLGIPSVKLFKRGEELGGIGGKQMTEMKISKFLREFRNKLV